MALGDVVFSPYRQQNPYGAPGYGIYPTRPGAYLYGLGQDAGAEVGWQAKIGVPTAGLAGVAAGLLVGFLIWGR